MIKEFIGRLLGLNIVPREMDEKEIKSAVGVWSIRQMVICPYCDHKFDMIAANLKRKTNQGRMVGKQIEVVKLGDGRSECETIDHVFEIPTPPYFGAMMEDTENLDEHIPCDRCKRTILIKETHWQYGEYNGPPKQKDK